MKIGLYSLLALCLWLFLSVMYTKLMQQPSNKSHRHGYDVQILFREVLIQLIVLEAVAPQWW